MESYKKRYHFCRKDFFNQLKIDKVIHADSRESLDNNSYAYNYIFKEKKINKGKGMFFLWEDPKKKGKRIEYSTYNECEFVLLEMEIPSYICIDTDYDNWCSFIMDLYEANGDYDIANSICLEYGIKNGLQGSYNAIFEIEEFSNIQTLVSYIDYDWVKNIKYTKDIIV